MQQISEQEFENFIKNNGLVLVDFYADWCAPCRKLTAVLENLSTTIDDVEIVKVNIDEAQQLSTQLGITSIPTVILFQNGVQKIKHVGLLHEEEIINMINSLSSTEE
ncbi:MAG: thioredoxin [Chlamydiia bacterium]|nr:thioredoxin [Chlamydiia bacterium]